jgi:hypothetical protein
MILVKLDPKLDGEEAKAAVSALVQVQKPRSIEEVKRKEVNALSAEAADALSKLGKPATTALCKALKNDFKGGIASTGENVLNAAARLAVLRILDGMGTNAYSIEVDGTLLTLPAS